MKLDLGRHILTIDRQADNLYRRIASRAWSAFPTETLETTLCVLIKRQFLSLYRSAGLT